MLSPLEVIWTRPLQIFAVRQTLSRTSFCLEEQVGRLITHLLSSWMSLLRVSLYTQGASRPCQTFCHPMRRTSIQVYGRNCLSFKTSETGLSLRHRARMLIFQCCRCGVQTIPVATRAVEGRKWAACTRSYVRSRSSVACEGKLATKAFCRAEIDVIKSQLARAGYQASSIAQYRRFIWQLVWQKQSVACPVP